MQHKEYIISLTVGQRHALDLDFRGSGHVLDGVAILVDGDETLHHLVDSARFFI